MGFDGLKTIKRTELTIAKKRYSETQSGKNELKKETDSKLLNVMPVTNGFAWIKLRSIQQNSNKKIPEKK